MPKHLLLFFVPYRISFKHIGCALLEIRHVRVGNVARVVQVYLHAGQVLVIPEPPEVLRGLVAAGAAVGNDHRRLNPPERNLFSVSRPLHSDVHLAYAAQRLTLLNCNNSCSLRVEIHYGLPPYI